jgi:hypothetical protein
MWTPKPRVVDNTSTARIGDSYSWVSLNNFSARRQANLLSRRQRSVVFGYGYDRNSRIPTRSPYNESQRRVMVFNSETRQLNDPDRELRQMWARSRRTAGRWEDSTIIDVLAHTYPTVGRAKRQRAPA